MTAGIPVTIYLLDLDPTNHRPATGLVIGGHTADEYRGKSVYCSLYRSNLRTLQAVEDRVHR